MTTKIGINGFGRMGRLVVRALAHHEQLEITHINELNCDAKTAAHLMQFDTVHGTWKREAHESEGNLILDGSSVKYSQIGSPGDVAWEETDVSIVIECTGAFRTVEALSSYFNRGIRKVVVAAPVHDETVLNVVMGCNDHLYDDYKYDIVTAASCTTNCIAPVVKVLHEQVGIDNGMITTIHAPTNTQVVVDKPLADPRRARSSLNSLIPTSTGSATAITRIFPDLEGKLDGLAVRVPVLNASLTDCVFSLQSEVSAQETNELLRQASTAELEGILGYEDRPLVSADFVNDSRSGIVDGLSTLKLPNGLVKILVWYDNEYGYVHRMAELTAKISKGL